mmetsp:Transcript_2877/g.5414  ORF Transcript_2877/g.5414 Transcript_2877/m.5414 type:complete len:288 (-) Transcript_2877:1298-2161(-)
MMKARCSCCLRLYLELREAGVERGASLFPALQPAAQGPLALRGGRGQRLLPCNLSLHGAHRGLRARRAHLGLRGSLSLRASLVSARLELRVQRLHLALLVLHLRVQTGHRRLGLLQQRLGAGVGPVQLRRRALQLVQPGLHQLGAGLGVGGAVQGVGFVLEGLPLAHLRARRLARRLPRRLPSLPGLRLGCLRRGPSLRGVRARLLGDCLCSARFCICLSGARLRVPNCSASHLHYQGHRRLCKEGRHLAPPLGSAQGGLELRHLSGDSLTHLLHRGVRLDSGESQS